MGLLQAGPLRVPVILGRAGISQSKREGDHATPAGSFPLRQVFYRPDREPPPVTALPCQALHPDDGWCDDPMADEYNQRVRRPYAGRHERLWRDDTLYDLIVVIGHNDDPVVAGAGSAIFMHLAAPDQAATAGCIALTRAHLRLVISLCDPHTSVVVKA